MSASFVCQAREAPVEAAFSRCFKRFHYVELVATLSTEKAVGWSLSHAGLAKR